MPVEVTYKAGDVYACGPFATTAHPTFDYETYSEAGFVWVPEAPVIPPPMVDPETGQLLMVAPTPAKPGWGKWASPPGMSSQNRGLPAVGTRNYVEHPTFEVLRLAYDLLDGVGMRRWTPDYSRMKPLGQGDDSLHPLAIIDHVRRGGMLEAVNVAFEWQAWNYHCVPKLGWPVLPQSQVMCCAAKARAAAIPGSLEPMGEVLFPLASEAHLRKDKAGKDLIRKLTVPKNPTKGNPALRWTRDTAAEDFVRFDAYNDQDVVAELAASLRLPDLSPYEERVWRMDLAINMRGMHVATQDVQNCIVIIEQAYAKYNAELRAITNGEVEGASEVAKMRAWMAARGVHLHELDEDTVADAIKRPGLPPAVGRVLRLRQILAFGSVKKLYAFRAQTCADGRLRDQYVYYGAHTGLWNGRGVQPANLYKGRFSKPEQVDRALAVIATGSLEAVEIEYGDALECVASCLRSMIVAKPGARLMSADFTAIQAVATSALAGEEWRLEVFRTHGKIYEGMASMLTGNPLQFYIDYKKEHGKHHEHRQDYGKIPVLSADFGAWIDGWKRFGADKLGDDATIKELIMKTRRAIPNIVELWGGQTRNKFGRDANGNRAPEFAQLYGLEGAAISAVLSPGECFAYRGIRFQQFDDTLYCMPPSGGIIRYHTPRLTRSTRQYASPWELELSYWGWNSNATKGAPGWQPMKLYGGVLTQNVVSHECREIQALALLRLEGHGDYPVVNHTHDENVVEVLDGRGSLEEYIAMVRGPLPAWAATPDGKPWPIKVPDAWEAQRYGKWED